jgi:alpha-mannosidase
MQKHLDLTRGRLAAWLNPDQLPSRLYPQKAPIQLAAWRAPGRVSFAEAANASYRPAQLGEVFGPLWATTWFKLDISVPLHWRNQEVHLLWDSFSEACVWHKGVPVQGLTGSGAPLWMNVSGPLRNRFPLPPGSKHTYYIEMTCNHLLGSTVLFGPDSKQVQLGKLQQAEIALFDREVWDLLWDYTVIADMALELPANTPRGAQALWTANEMINAWDLDDRKTWPAVRRIARRFLAARNGDSQHTISAIGHAHIDTAWLWPLAETVRKCYRTFATAVAYMDEYPEYRFVCSQAQHFAWMKEHQPALYTKIKRKVSEGGFIPSGGTWVEPDCNVPSGESLIRQFIFGQRFFKKEFGRYCREFWNPDVFGYNGQLPQIMRGAGIRRFLTKKLSENQFNKPNAHTFWWEGIDGSRVLTHFPPADTYTGNGSVRELLFNVTNYKDLDRSNESCYLFGHGDGGGGPTWEMLEQLRRCRDTDGIALIQQRSPEEFFDRLEADMKGLTTQVGELYFERHRGTYTTHAKTKLNNRRSEVLLHDVEFLAAVAPGPYPRAELDRLWKLVLLNQFHDIIPGSSITEVYSDSARHYADILSTASELREAAAQRVLRVGRKRLAVFNTLGFPRREVVTVEGKPTIVSAPSLGYAVQELTRTHAASVHLVESKAGFMVENDHIRARIRRDGHVTSLQDKRTGRETLSGAANHFILFEDRPINCDAWDVDAYHLEKSVPVAGAKSCFVAERNPLRVTLEFQYDITAKSKMRQRIMLDAVSPRLEFSCEVDWHEAHKFLKVEFPTTVRSELATYEIQFGHLQRPTHFNTSYDLARFEVCAHRWADLSEPGCGLALLNDCKYGHAAHGNVMRLSLLRSPKSPDPEADMGRHQFRYALMPHSGDLRESGVITAARAFNSPLLLQKTDAPPGAHSFFSVDNPGVVIDTVKRAEDSNDIIVRLYESYGSRSRVKLITALPIAKAIRCNFLEEDERPLSRGLRFDIAPFQIVTLKLRLSR